MNSDECYDYEFLQHDSDDEDFNEKNEEEHDTSTSQNKRKRLERTSYVQFRKLYEFMESHDKNTLEKEVFNQQWDNLVSELNDLGPPSRTSARWRRIWIDNKSKKLKKSKQSVSPETSGTIKNATEQQTSSSATVHQIHEASSSKKETLTLGESRHLEYAKDSKLESDDSSFRLKVMEKLETIIEQNKKANENFNEMVAEAKRTRVNIEVMVAEIKRLNDNMEAMIAEVKRT